MRSVVAIYFGGVCKSIIIVDQDDEENWFRSHEDQDDDVDDEETPVYLHSGLLPILNRDHLATKWQRRDR